MSPILVALAAVSWGVSGGIGAVLVDAGWDPIIVSWYRGAIGLVCVLGWLAARPRGSGLGDPRLWLWSTIAGLGVAGNFVFYLVGAASGGVAVTATLMYCAPVFVYLVSFALGLERPMPMKWGAIVLVVVGIVLLTRVYDVGGDRITLIAVVAGLISGLCYALFIFGFKYAAPRGTPQSVLSIAFAALVLTLVWLSPVPEARAVLYAQRWWLFVVLGLLGAGLSFFLYVVGLEETAPAVASVIAMVEPVTASLFGFVVLTERLVGIQIFGMALILVTVTVLSVASGRHWASAEG